MTLIRTLLIVGVFMALAGFLFSRWFWVVLAVLFAATLVLTQIPYRAVLYECPHCRKAFHISVFERRLCPDKGEMREVDCPLCGMTGWVYPAGTRKK